jgi:N-methylhydantoinase A
MPVLGVDTGGTFTDFYLMADDGAVSVYKRPSTPGDPARAILEGLAELAGEAPSTSPTELVHGSTVATNAIIERKGVRTALITTRGFRDVLAIGRQTRPRLYDLSPQREPPLVPDDLRLEANERLDHGGEVLQGIDPAEVETLLDYVQQNGVESLAVCFLFSFVNPDHERLVAEAARTRGIATSASYEVLPEHREYERTSTTVANAYVAPVMARYLSRLEKGARKHRVKRLRVMASNGGSVSPAAAGRLAIRTALSGPAGGVAGAFALAQRAGYDRIVTLDMGGKSTDVALCPGRILERDETLVGELPVRGPTVDVISVGAGGGSIARLDEGGALRVGPESAGADPGPACYGRGERATVTDAHVVLGRIAPQQFLGGRMSIDVERSFAALRRLVSDEGLGAGAKGHGGRSEVTFGGDAHLTAAAVLRVANANMERALRIVSVERGHDPRDFTLVAFGGAGPLHACDLAAALRIPRVLIPPHPGVLSALGMATAPIVKDLSAAVMVTIEGGSDVRASHLRREKRSAPSGDVSQQAPVPASVDASPLRVLARTRDELEKRGRKELKAEGFSLAGISTMTFLEMRYAGQSYELSIPVDSLAPDVFLTAFHAAHQERYDHSDMARLVDVVTLRLKLVLPAMEMRNGKGGMREGKRARGKTAGRKPREREVWFDSEAVRTLVHERTQLRPGARLAGPAVVVQMDSTTAVPPGWTGEVDPMGNLVLERA